MKKTETFYETAKTFYAKSFEKLFYNLYGKHNFNVHMKEKAQKPISIKIIPAIQYFLIDKFLKVDHNLITELQLN